MEPAAHFTQAADNADMYVLVISHWSLAIGHSEFVSPRVRIVPNCPLPAVKSLLPALLLI